MRPATCCSDTSRADQVRLDPDQADGEGLSMTHSFHPTMLREYDMRGVVGETLGEKDAYAVGRTFGALVGRAGGSAVAVGRDGRLSSPLLERPEERRVGREGVMTFRSRWWPYQ